MLQNGERKMATQKVRDYDEPPELSKVEQLAWNKTEQYFFDNPDSTKHEDDVFDEFLEELQQNPDL